MVVCNGRLEGVEKPGGSVMVKTVVPGVSGLNWRVPFELEPDNVPTAGFELVTGMETGPAWGCPRNPQTQEVVGPAKVAGSRNVKNGPRNRGPDKGVVVTVLPAVLRYHPIG
jgi:hypothetical protein